MSVAQRLGLGPTRTMTSNPDNTFTITVTPPKWADCGNGASVRLTADQARRFLEYLDDDAQLIQDLLPELSDDEREILLSGIDNTTWDKMFGEGKL